MLGPKRFGVVFVVETTREENLKSTYGGWAENDRGDGRTVFIVQEEVGGLVGLARLAHSNIFFWPIQFFFSARYIFFPFSYLFHIFCFITPNSLIQISTGSKFSGQHFRT